jgi:hypothetical protein
MPPRLQNAKTSKNNTAETEPARAEAMAGSRVKMTKTIPADRAKIIILSGIIKCSRSIKEITMKTDIRKSAFISRVDVPKRR